MGSSAPSTPLGRGSGPIATPSGRGTTPSTPDVGDSSTPSANAGTPCASRAHSPRTPGATFPSSPSQHNRTPKGSLQLPLLRSHIVNLDIRHQTLSTTLTTRAGAVLDKMIDHAGPLEGLGGIAGRKTNKADAAGAVPDELLDLQDGLEREIEGLAERLEVCRELERQWKVYVSLSGVYLC